MSRQTAPNNLADRRRAVPRTLLLACLLFGAAVSTGTLLYGHAGAAHDADTSAARPYWLAPGPWGRLRAVPVSIAPPNQHWQPFFVSAPRERWVFAETTAANMSRLLFNLDLSQNSFKHLVADTRYATAIDGFVVTPAAALVRQLPAPIRARLYDRLAEDALNLPEVNAFRYWGNSVDQWLAGAGLSAATRRRISRLSYRNGHWLYFADLSLVMPTVPQTRRRALELALCRQATLRLSLHIAHGQHLAPLIRYWGRHQRQGGIARLLEPLAAATAGGAIDVDKLLPSFARRHLYTYPRPVGPLPANESRDCHWSALNFFNRRADSRFADSTVVAAMLHTRYHRVAHPRFGDLVEFISHDIIFHSAVYIADNILFTKNGARSTQPWLLLPLAVMKDFYPTAGPVHIVYLRGNAHANRIPAQPMEAHS